MCLVGEELKVFMNLVVRLLGEAKGVCESRVLVFFFFFELKFHVYYFYTSDCHHLELEFPFLNSNL